MGLRLILINHPTFQTTLFFPGKGITEAMSNNPQEILKNIFGYDEFKPLQREVIQNVLQKKDTLTIMPTGGGNPCVTRFRP